MKKFLIAFLFLFTCLPLSRVLAQETEFVPQEELLEGRVVSILDEQTTIQAGEKLLYQKLGIKITKGSLKDKEITVETGDIPVVGQPKYQVGNKVVINYSKDFEGNDVFYITDFVRRQPLLWLFLIFVILAIVVGHWRGASSLLGLAISFLIIFAFILPQIYRGSDPIIIAIFGSLVIIPVTFILSHGFNRKTLVAMVGTFIALIVVGILSQIFIGAARLTGYASEEAAYLHLAKQGAINMRGILLAGIIIGALGVLDDITIAQAAVVQQLKEANPKLKWKELFSRAMNVGQDHIASMINTLVLVYTGAALPLLLLFIDTPRPFNRNIKTQMITEEIVRTLVGSIGLILAVPITTLLASRVAFKK